MTNVTYIKVYLGLTDRHGAGAVSECSHLETYHEPQGRRHHSSEDGKITQWDGKSGD